MALNFERPAQTAQPTLTLEPVEVKPYDILEDRDRTVAQLADSEEIDRLTSQIDINDMTTIVTFGAQTVEEISKASDVVLRSMNMGQMDQSSQMLESLAKIMSKFDIDEFKDSPKLFGRLLGNVRGQLERILTKYNTMGDEVDRIYVQLRGYEAEIKRWPGTRAARRSRTTWPSARPRWSAPATSPSPSSCKPLSRRRPCSSSARWTCAPPRPWPCNRYR